MTEDLRKLAEAARIAKDRGASEMRIHPDALLAIAARVAELEAALGGIIQNAGHAYYGEEKTKVLDEIEKCARAAAAMEGK